MSGHQLLHILVEATGLPKTEVRKELERLMKARGLSAETVTLDQIRELLAGYLQEVLLGAKAGLNDKTAEL